MGSEGVILGLVDVSRLEEGGELDSLIAIRALIGVLELS